MKKTYRSLSGLFAISLLGIFLLVSCSQQEKNNDKIVVGITAGLETINPLYSFSVNEANIDELLFLSLIKHKWDWEKGDIESEPMLAKSWEWNNDSSAITLNLRDDVEWSDGVKFTTDDVVYSFDLYSDPVVQSYMYGGFENFYTDKNNHVLIDKTFEIFPPNKIVIKFKPGSTPTLFNIDFPIIPKHVFEKIDRKSIPNSDINFNPVTNGPFKLKRWEKNQYIILEKNPKSFLTTSKMIGELVFKVVPEYTSRINQLKTGELDLTEFIKTDDLDDLKKIESLNLENVKGREYDYIGWSNIDRNTFNTNNKIKPNFLFGSSKVRIALTHAVNRNEILKSYLKNNGSLCIGPVSSIFKNAVNPAIQPYKYDPTLAKKMLEEEGWKDSDHDGILDKDNKKFEFILTIPSGNPRRSYAATIIKKNLSDIGININIESIELGAFINRLSNREMDAWMAGWIIPLPIDLNMSWYSDLKTTPFNFTGYQNRNVDKIIDELKITRDENMKNLLLREVQEILHNDEPATFLYWVDNIVAYNNRIKGIDINPLGVIQHCWNWTKN